MSCNFFSKKKKTKKKTIHLFLSISEIYKTYYNQLTFHIQRFMHLKKKKGCFEDFIMLE